MYQTRIYFSFNIFSIKSIFIKHLLYNRYMRGKDQTAQVGLSRNTQINGQRPIITEKYLISRTGKQV